MKTHCRLLLLPSTCRPFFILAMLFFACLPQSKAQKFPDPPGAKTGQITIKLLPSGIGAGWHFVGEKTWHDSGSLVTGIALGKREIEFKPVPNYIQPIGRQINLTKDKTGISLTLDYFDSSGGATGKLKVILKPDEVAAGSASQTKRAQWRLLGEGDGKWLDSGEARELQPGDYLVETKPVTGTTAPRAVSVKVLANKTTSTTAVYFDQDSSTGAQPEVLDFTSINDPDSNLPYAYVGQVRTDNSEGTGCVVLDHTVATAAHVIFDEQNLTYFGGLEWLFQRFQGIHYSASQRPRRAGILTSYAAQRVIDDSPGHLSDLSKNCDVAALYFLNPPGRNGFSGYVFSDNATNEYLTSFNLKTMACYPTDGVSSLQRGKMHATTPSNFLFTGHPAFPDSTPNTLYSTTDFSSPGGAAGAPVFVRNNSGVYECAAIYLGSYPQTDVRSFTGDVDVLFLWANNDGVGPNGGITRIDGPGSQGGFTPGAIKINLKPSSGRWKLGESSTARTSGSTVSNLLPGTYTINFTPVTGYQKPSPASVIVTGGQLTSLDVKYTRLKPGPNPKVTGEDFRQAGPKHISK